MVPSLSNQFTAGGKLGDAVEALGRVVRGGGHVSVPSFYHMLKRCMAEKDLSMGQRVHALTVASGYESNTFLANHTIRFYASLGMVEEALQVFNKVAAPDTHMWASIILAHVRHQQSANALKLYQRMRKSGTNPDNHIFVAALDACAKAANLSAGKEIHGDILGCSTEPDIFVGNYLLEMYVKCGSIKDARSAFDTLRCKDVVTWNSIISGYAQHGLGQEALNLYSSMVDQYTVLPNSVTFVCLLQACGSIGALHQGKELHAQIQQWGLEADVAVGSSLVDMYAKCGSMDNAQRVFDTLASKNVVTWTALLNGYAQCSNGFKVRQCFGQMREQGVEPNAATFVSLLVACSHDGLVAEGQQYFKMMVQDHGIAPSIKHFTCMVDLLGRSGCLDEAERMLRETPFESEAVGWVTLLSACKNHNDIQRGQRCFDRLILLEPESARAYALLASIYASAGRWADVGKLESLRKSAGAAKKPGKACIEVKSRVLEFTVGEERADVSLRLRSANSKLKRSGHVPQTELVLKSVSNHEKEDVLCGHAEKLALAYGLLNTPDGTPLLVTKNLRMCNDCHASTKVMSRLEKREIVVRDAHRVHRFQDGSCSCLDRH